MPSPFSPRPGRRGAVRPLQDPCDFNSTLALEIDIQPERAHLLYENIEALRNARLERVVPSDDRLIDLGTPGHVVRFHGQHLLQGEGGAIGFERPHLHLAEALSAELSLAAERLLGDQRIGTDRAGMDLVVDEVMQLQDIYVSDRHFAIERLAGPSVV